MQRAILTFTLCLAASWLSGCDSASRESRSSSRPPALAEGARGFEAKTSPADSMTDAAALDALARRLAGLVSGDGPVWSRHFDQMQELWGEIERRHLTAIRAWTAKALGPRVPEPGLPLFYPFGGPDFLSAFLLFPEAPTYVLVGLQPPGRLPRPDELTPEALESELERLRSGFESMVEAGYFQQTDMDADFAAERLDGVLPVLYIFLARTGHHLTALRYRVLDESGHLAAAGPGEDAGVVEIVFTSHGEERTLIYFAQDLSDAGLAAKSDALSRYLDGIESWNVFMKAAVYLLHMDGFTTLRDLLLARSRTLLQDDSGLAHRDLDPQDWDLFYFGDYTRTLPVYREWFQEDLKAVYESKVARPLDFAIGYHSQIGEGCLILANRRNAP